MNVILYARYEPEEMPYSEVGIPHLEMLDEESFDTFEEAVDYISNSDEVSSFVNMIVRDEAVAAGIDMDLIEVVKSDLIDGNKIIYDEVYEGRVIQRFEFVAYEIFW